MYNFNFKSEQDCIQIVYNLYMIISVYKLYTVTVYNLYTILKDFFHVGLHCLCSYRTDRRRL